MESSNGETNNENPNYDEKIINWVEEATAIINDVKTHVANIQISEELPSTDSNIYLNICTKEDEKYCVHVSSLGFRIVGNQYDTIEESKKNINEEEIFETPYALLDKISPQYVESFGNQLCKQLLKLQQNQKMQTQFNEEDEDALEEEDEGEQVHCST